MFDRAEALRIIQDNSMRSRLSGYTVKCNSVTVNVRRVDIENDIYRVIVMDWSKKTYPIVPSHIIEEMTPEQAVDRFQELLCHIAVSNALFGWINGNG